MLLRHLQGKQAGQIMALVVLLMGLGAVSTGVGLAMVASATRGSTATQEDQEAYYAAAAAVEAVFADLLEGQDILDPSYTLPDITVNGIKPKIEIAAPAAGGASPRTIYRYVDPGASAGLATLGPEEVYRVRLLNVEPFSALMINWEFTTSDKAKAKIEIFDSTGKKLETKKVKVRHDVDLEDLPEGTEDNRDDEGSVTYAVSAELTGDDSYLIEFINDKKDKGSIFTESFNGLGGASSTWVYAKLKGREYVITARAVRVSEAAEGGAPADQSPVVLRAYVRQLPGANVDNQGIRHKLVVESWRRVEETAAAAP